MDSTSTDIAPAPLAAAGAGAIALPQRRRRFSLITPRDKLVLVLMVGVPVAFDLVMIWGPTLASVFLSFTNWRGIGPVTAHNLVGLRNYRFLFNGYIYFWPAVAHNLIWLAFFLLFATPLGILMAVLLDRELRGSRIYQNVFFLPVVLSLAIVGFIWTLQFSPSDGFINSTIALVGNRVGPDWLGNPKLNLWSVLVAATWRHVGYVMILYLAGLKSVDPTLREAAAIDGANAVQTFVRVVFPAMAPINVVILVITIIESLRAFDIVYIINHGTNGLELLSTLITNNSISEANLVGFGSAIAVILLVISLVPILSYLAWVSRERA